MRRLPGSLLWRDDRSVVPGSSGNEDETRNAVPPTRDEAGLRTHLINRERARCRRFGAAARREEGEYPLWIFDRRATQQQRQRSATRRAVFWRAPGGVAPQSQSALAMLLRRALPAARQSRAPISYL